MPTAEILKFEQGSQDVITMLCAFDNADASDFVIGGISGEDAKYVEFDRTMRLKTKYDIEMSIPKQMGSGYFSESEEIDFTDYKKVEVVE